MALIGLLFAIPFLILALFYLARPSMWFFVWTMTGFDAQKTAELLPWN